jgi:hypothetical protein
MTGARRLAAIMAVDFVGYRRLMGEDEAGTARAVKEHRDATRRGRSWPSAMPYSDAARRLAHGGAAGGVTAAQAGDI